MKTVYVFCDFETTGLFDFKKPNKKVYPIEVGLIFTDENYSIYDTYKSLIKWPSLYDEIKKVDKSCYVWPSDYYDAFKVHMIGSLFYCLRSKMYNEVALDIYSKISEIRNSIKTYEKEKVRFILISDNIQFEFKLMEILLKDIAIDKKFDWPFHYCGYDTNEMLIKTGIGDPIPEHTALRDAALIHRNMIRALEKIKKDS